MKSLTNAAKLIAKVSPEKQTIKIKRYIFRNMQQFFNVSSASFFMISNLEKDFHYLVS